jgi:hypothetical protein
MIYSPRMVYHEEFYNVSILNVKLGVQHLNIIEKNPHTTIIMKV